MKVGDIYKYKHLASIIKVRIIDREEAIQRRGILFVEAFERNEPEYLFAYDERMDMTRAVHKPFLKKYGVKL